MFDDANGPQVAWLLPFALLGAPICFWRWRRDRAHRAAVVLWLGWVLLFGAVFSLAGASTAATTLPRRPRHRCSWATVAALVHLTRRHWAWLAAPIAIAGTTAWVQLDTAPSFAGTFDSSPTVGMAVVGIGAVALTAFTLLRRPVATSPALASIAIGLLVIPASWTAYEATHTSMNTTLPQAGPREGAAGRSFGSAAFDPGVSGLASWLSNNGDPATRWDLVASSAMNASTLIAEYNLSVMAIGGFSGSDPTITVDDFANLVDQGEVRYVLVSAGGFAGGGFNAPTGFGRTAGRDGGAFPGRNGSTGPGTLPGQSRGQQTAPAFGAGPTGSVTSPGAGSNAVMSAVRNACTPVSSSDLPAQYQGSIYDCSGRAGALRAG
jgi:4-amino-4-deoxy-L-arabinose transferase-like glycosyltransferase